MTRPALSFSNTHAPILKVLGGIGFLCGVVIQSGHCRLVSLGSSGSSGSGGLLGLRTLSRSLDGHSPRATGLPSCEAPHT